MSRLFPQLRDPRIVAVTPIGDELPSAVLDLSVAVQHRWPDPVAVLESPEPVVLIVDARQQPAEMLTFVRTVRTLDPRMPIVGIFGSFGLLSLTPAQGLTDFVTDEAGPGELGMRLQRAVASRHRARTEPVGQAIALSEQGFGVRIQGREVRLSFTEHELIRLLLANRDRVLEHAEIAQALNDVGGKLDSAAVRIVVSRTRAKLGPDAGAITTVRGVGYRLIVPRRLNPVRAAS